MRRLRAHGAIARRQIGHPPPENAGRRGTGHRRPSAPHTPRCRRLPPGSRAVRARRRAPRCIRCPYRRASTRATSGSTPRGQSVLEGKVPQLAPPSAEAATSPRPLSCRVLASLAKSDHGARPTHRMRSTQDVVPPTTGYITATSPAPTAVCHVRPAIPRTTRDRRRVAEVALARRPESGPLPDRDRDVARELASRGEPCSPASWRSSGRDNCPIRLRHSYDEGSPT